MIRLIRHERGPRVYILGRRVHHGSVGCGLLAVGCFARLRSLRVIAFAMILHDGADFPFRDCDNH